MAFVYANEASNPLCEGGQYSQRSSLIEIRLPFMGALMLSYRFVLANALLLSDVESERTPNVHPAAWLHYAPMERRGRIDVVLVTFKMEDLRVNV